MAAKRSKATKTQGSGEKRKKSSAPPKKRPAGMDKKKLRAEMESAVLKKGQAVIEAVIRQAELQGGYLPAKYLFEFAGIAQPLPETPAEPDLSPAGTLMDILLGPAKPAGETTEVAKAEQTREK